MMSCKRKFFQWGSLLIVYRALNLTVQYAKSGAYIHVCGCVLISYCDVYSHSDCQQQAGLAAWVPFQDSASAVTQLYKGRHTDTASVCVCNDSTVSVTMGEQFGFREPRAEFFVAENPQ